MKKKLYSLALALVLIICMAVPAFAASNTESGNWGGIDYSRTVSYTASKATMTMSFGLHTTNLTVQARATVKILSSGNHCYGENFYNTGKEYVSVSTTNSAYDPENDYIGTGTVVGARGNSKVGTNEYMGYIYA